MTRIAHVIVDGEQNYAQKIQAGRHALTSDEPKVLNGEDTGPSPYGLVLSGLGACTSITLRMYAQRKGWELGTIHVDLVLEDDDGKQRIERKVTFSAPLSDEQRAKLADISEKTPVTRTLKTGLTIHTTVA